jgi:hypothetical protein
MNISINTASSPSASRDPLISADDGALALPIDDTAGDPITEIAVLLAQSFREERKQARDASDAAEASRLHEAEQQVQAMRDKASSLRHEGWIKGATMVLSGGCGVLGAGGSIGQSEEDARRTMTRWSATGKGAEGLGVIFGNSYEADAQEHQAEADLHDARASAYKVSSEKYRDEADEAQRMTKKVMEFLEHARESRDATAGAASAIRG